MDDDGGKGGRASGTLTVTPGETLQIYVGGQGVGAGAGGWNVVVMAVNGALEAAAQRCAARRAAAIE